MNVLVACEFSGIVREAFNKKGHNAWSCDLLDTDLPGNHYTCDIFEAIEKQKWDLTIAFPPCTYLSVSGMHWTTRGLRDAKLTEDALSFVQKLMSAPIPKIAIENPISIISSRIRKPDQIIQPWWFGHNASKATCLWLKNLPKLKPTKIVPPNDWSLVKFAADFPSCECCEDAFCTEHNKHFSECDCIGPTEDGVIYKEKDGFLFGNRNGLTKMLWDNQTPSGQNKLGPSKDRWKLRSKTYEGFANSMADQWK